MVQFDNARQLVSELQPEVPVVCRRPRLAERAARLFLDNFPGDVLYAVKANPAPWLIETLHGSGISHFDAASLTEIRLVREHAPGATIGFMHPMKMEAAIAEAYRDHGVRIFSLDTMDELEKILRATGHAKDLTLCVRLQVGSDLAKISLSSKFGADEADDAALLQDVRVHAERLGVCFHVGSQAMSPAAFAGAMERAARAVRRAGVIVDVVDVGGGFPAIYPGMEPPALDAYFAEIAARFEDFPSSGNARLWCEPGRALSADTESLIVRVMGRKGDALFINDGAYGALYDAAHLGWRFPAHNLSRDQEGDTPFRLYGPTCDDADQMRGPFFLPDTTEAGDYIEFGTIGAYGRSMVTGFNGYGRFVEAALLDDPFPSLCNGAAFMAAEELTR
ncbi:type III PLP-dependent enzyme domain-containing protein [Parvularcula lutaonensis]|uniref:ornithine decarboxylase n=1 Tax=Parvularcula lutaonensis TaxID=491923 RepID=A0ABV7MG04_9PROT|nr:type III PLP-dependent enzyme [Parvularcula lutaonensis]GGY54117.1 ornithine decarboxylase [Parvularcula lutaonensis]